MDLINQLNGYFNIIFILIFSFINFLILTIWLYLFNNIFPYKINKIKILILIILSGLVSGITILSIPNIGNNLFDFTKENLLNQFIGFYLWIFLSFIIILFHIILNKKKFIKKYIFFLIWIIFSTIFLILSFIISKSNIDYLLKYFLFVALSEEFIKFMIGVSLYCKYKIIKNDIIIFSIFSALGFSFVENIVYIFYFLTNQDNQNLIIGLIGLTLTRGIIGFLVHSLFTGNIGLFHLFGFIKNFLIIFSIIGILIGISLHFIYNSLIGKGFWWISIAIIIIGYFWISWLFYISDRLYIWYEKEYL